MSYENFKRWCEEKAKEAKCAIKGIRHNEEIGRYEALFSEGTVIYGNPLSCRVAVKFGSRRQHRAMKDISKEVAKYA